MDGIDYASDVTSFANASFKTLKPVKLSYVWSTVHSDRSNSKESGMKLAVLEPYWNS
jgi:hypothetical protein